MPTSDTPGPSFDPLANLPDRPALEQLGRAIWSRGALRGAAVLVGAGVSRGGVRLLSEDAPLPPLWFNLANEMARELYGTKSTNAPKDPLRLAEEFRAGFGDAALADFLRRHIRDDTYEPGQIHRDLLELPWADVLTTNYDTLLERAAQDTRRGYDVVLAENDLAHAGGPRIIKLHGSLRDGAAVVISEEDYRHYPDRQAAFVNTARQIFVENELCLLGFSGDDPNFLQWAGWVRDRLGGRARRIYLVGALDLPPVKRRLLEARGIAPIDLAPAVQNERADQRHAAAITLFLAYLKASRPAEPDDWKPVSYRDYPSLRRGNHENWHRDYQNSEKVLESFRGGLAIWRADRQACPHWLVCPRNVRTLIQSGIDAIDNLLLALNNMAESERWDALLELAWRHDRGARPLPPWLVERMDELLTAERLAEVDPELIRALARSLLSAARLADDEEALEARAEIFKQLTAPRDLSAIIVHERCLLARDRLDFEFVAEHVGSIEGDDPVLGLQRAALLYWVGETDDALQAIGLAARTIRSRVLRDPDSVALRSRLAWVKLLAEALNWEDQGSLVAEVDGLDRLALRDYDTWDQIRAIDAEVGEGLRKRLEARSIEPGFEMGTYSDKRNTITFGSGIQVTPLGELRHIAERVGLPIRMRYVNMLGTRLADALRFDFEPTAAWHSIFLATKPSYSKGPIDIHFGRIPIARLDASTVDQLRKRIEKAITFWCARVRRKPYLADDVEALRLYIEALSRVAARDNADSAKRHARLAVEIGSDNSLRHWWLNEPIGHLLRRAVDATPRDQRSELSPELMRFPLAAERDEGGPSMSWYDPGPDAYRFVRRGENEAIFDARVATFLHHLLPGQLSRPEAAVRLLYLHEEGQLTDGQVSSFADNLWRDVPRDSHALPEGTNLLLHAFLIAPAPPDIDVRARVYAHLFSPGAEADPVHLIAAASGRRPYLQPSEADAVRLFRNVIAWRPEAPPPDSLKDAFARPTREEGDRRMATILGIVVAPALARQDRTVERAEAVLTFLDQTGLLEGLVALPMFYGLDTEVDSQIVNVFRRPLAMGDQRATHAAVQALDRWLHLSETGQASALPNVIRDQVLRSLERGKNSVLSNFIYLARRLVESGRCGSPELDRIVDVLDELRIATDYGLPDGDADVEPERVVSLPVIRAECVRLARSLESRGVTTEPVRAWQELADRDPLPEVRGAACYVIGE